MRRIYASIAGVQGFEADPSAIGPSEGGRLWRRTPAVPRVASRSSEEEESRSPDKKKVFVIKFQYMEQPQHTNISSPTYFSISIRKLVLLSVFTLGLYQIYWFYKNFEAEKGKDDTVFSLLLKSILAIFYCRGLFTRILTSAEKQGQQILYSANTLAVIWIALTVVGNGLGKEKLISMGLGFLWIVAAACSVAPLVPIQQTINSVTNKKSYTKSLNTLELVVVVLGALRLILVVAYALIPNIFTSFLMLFDK